MEKSTRTQSMIYISKNTTSPLMVTPLSFEQLINTINNTI